MKRLHYPLPQIFAAVFFVASFGIFGTTALNYFTQSPNSLNNQNNSQINNPKINQKMLLAQAVAAPTSGLVGYWNFDEGSGTTAADGSGNSNTGTLTNGPTWLTGTSAKVGNGALQFDGVNDRVDAGSNSVLKLTHTGTFATWVKFDSLNAYKTLVSNGSMQGAGNNGVDIYTAGGSIEGSLDNGSTNHRTIRGGTQLTTSQWYLVVLTWDGSFVNLYINGTADTAPVAQTFDPTPAYNFMIGHDGNLTNTAQLAGSLDDVRVYNRALSSSEVSDLYAWGNAGGTGGTGGTGGDTGNTGGGATTYSLTVASSINGNITSNPSGINCGTGGSSCSVSSIAAGTTYTLTAVPATGYTTAWSGCSSSSGNSCTVVVNSNTTVTPTFSTVVVNQPPGTGPYSLTIQKAGAGTGHVANTTNSSNYNTLYSVYFAGYIFCATTCTTNSITAGTVETLVAVSAGDSVFTGWSGGGCSGTGSCTVTMSADTTVTATFAKSNVSYLTVYKSYEGSGTVTGSGIDCGSTCTVSKSIGTAVTLTATPNSGSVFLNWGGACSGTATTCTVTLNTSQVVTALFQTTAAMNGPTANGVLEPGEACDGNDFGGITVIAGYRSGTLKCKTDRTGYDLSSMVAGNTVNATDCTVAAVQAAIDQAQDGDTVQVPAGTCTWTTSVHIGSFSGAHVYSGKSIILKGAPNNGTTIIDNMGAGSSDTWGSQSPIHVMTTANKPVRITGFTFDGRGSKSSQAIVLVEGDVVASHNRVDHNIFVNVTTRGIAFQTYGVMDHNTLTRDKNAGSVTLISVFGDQDASWARPPSLGTANAAYMEDNVFDHCCVSNGPYDNYGGDRYVFRYNQVYGSHLGHHGYDSQSNGNMGYEVYGNHMVNESITGSVSQYPHDLLIENRSGTGVVYNNTATRSTNAVAGTSGFYDDFIYLKNYRSSDGYNWGIANGYNYQRGTFEGYSSFCDGSTHLGGLVDGSAPGMEGYPCRDQIGRTTGQALSPTYLWNNNFQGVVGGNAQAVGYGTPPAGGVDRSTSHIVEGRDFYNGVPKPGYTALVYPHPLVQVDGAQASGGTTYTVSVTKAGTGTGTVTSSVGGISCGSTCSASISNGTTVVLTAVPNSGATVTWSGCTTSTATTCTVSTNASVTVTFGSQAAADTTPPTISLTAPTNNSTVSGTVNLGATASDNTGGSGVVGVQFKLDVTANIGTELSTAPYTGTWSTIGVLNGIHTIIAVARDAAGNIATSSPVTVTVNNIAQDTTSPTIPLNFTATSTSDTQVNLTWSASTDPQGSNQAVSGIAGYKIYRNGVLLTTTALTSYSNTGLSANTTYTYAVTAYDGAGNESAQSISATAKTLPPPDTTAPTISALSVSLVTSNSATFNWTTNEAADTLVDYGPTLAYGSSTFTASLGTIHNPSIISLKPSTLYNYRITSKDAAGNPRSQTGSFTTQAASSNADITPPAISNLALPLITDVAVTVAWTTNEPATSRIDYGLTSAYGSAQTDPTLSLTHSITLSGLTRKTQYAFKITATDASGNATSTTNQSLTTNPRAAKPPKVTGVSATAGSIILSWTNPTYEYLSKVSVARSTTASPQTLTAGNKMVDLTTTPTWRDTNVVDGTTYYYSLFSVDDQGTVGDPEFVAYTPQAAGNGNNSNPGGNTGNGGNTGGNTGGTGTFTPTVPQLPPAVQNNNANNAACVPTTIPSTLTPLPAGTTNFTIGTRSATVTTLQTFLVSKGYLTRDSITGYYGPLTNAAVVKYKAALLPRTVACPITPVAAGATGASRLVKGFQFTATLIPFATNAQVKSVQIFLNDHGYTVAITGSGSKGNETAYFGNATKAALIKFQKANNITPAIGNWGPLTRAKVNSLLK